MQPEDRYFSRHLTQTAFRYSKRDASESGSSMNLRLSNLNISDNQRKKELRERIKNADELLLSILLPDFDQTKNLQEDRLNAIFKQLGIDYE